MSLADPRRWALALTVTAGLLSARVSAQTSTTPVATKFWLAAGPVWVSGEPPIGGIVFGKAKVGFAAVSTVHSGHLVLSGRVTVAGTGPVAAWDLGVLAGVGSYTGPPVYGSIAAGLGRSSIQGRGSGISIPAQIEIGWRITGSFGVGLYGFGSFAGPDDFLGLGLMARVGRLR